MKRILYTLVAVLFLFSGALSAQQDIYKIWCDVPDTVVHDGKAWETAYPSINDALQYIPTQGRNVVFLVHGGDYGPVKIWGTGMKSVEIYGNCDEFCYAPGDRLLDDFNYRTVFRGTADQPAIWLESMGDAQTNIIDCVTLIGGQRRESLAARIVGTYETIFSRCRIQDTDCDGNLFFLEGWGNTRQNMLSFVNSVISDNKVSTLVSCFYSARFVNSTVVNNECNTFMSISYPEPDNVFEIKNSIIYNTRTYVTGTHNTPVYVYNSIVDNFMYLKDFGGNVSGIDVEFSGSDYEPYEHVPGQYVTAKGDIAHILPYLTLLGNTDIVDNARYDRRTKAIDIGAYQGDQRYSAPMLAPEFDSENPELDKAVRIYPTDIYSGESVYFENNLESALTARIYSVGGLELYSASLSSQSEQLTIPLAAGVYIVIVTDDATGERISQEKIIIH